MNELGSNWKAEEVKPSLDVVVVNWNAGRQLRECLESIAECDKSTFELQRVVVVDNASTDNSVSNLESLQLPLLIIRNRENRGFAAACNQGAADHRSDHLLFLNPDTRLFQDTLERSMQFFDEPGNSKVGVLGIQMRNGSAGIWRTCSTFPTPASFLSAMLGLDRLFPHTFKSHLMVDWDHAESREVDHVMGCYYLVRASLFRQLAGFDERFFVYLEDVDFSLRARNAGAQVYFYAGATAFHQGGGVSAQVKSLRLFYALRSRIQYSIKHFNRAGAIIVTVGTLIVEPITRIILSVGKLSPRTALETLGAYFRLWISVPSFATGRWRPGK